MIQKNDKEKHHITKTHLTPLEQKTEMLVEQLSVLS
jgi:hypothetical protein